MLFVNVSAKLDTLSKASQRPEGRKGLVGHYVRRQEEKDGGL
jgi:hypothetical protein